MTKKQKGGEQVGNKDYRQILLSLAYEVSHAAKASMEKSLSFKKGMLSVKEYAESLRCCGDAYFELASEVMLHEKELENIRREFYGVKQEDEDQKKAG